MRLEKNDTKTWKTRVVGALIVGLSVGSLATMTAATPESAIRSVESLTSAPAALDAESLNQGFRTVVQAALPAVVNISASKTVATRSAAFPFSSNPFFFFDRRDFGEFDMPRERVEEGQGSGVIVSRDGYVLTNHHVVGEATDITVSLDGQREFTAELVGTDALTDIAVLKIDGDDLPFLSLGDSTAVEVGDVVLAMGNPFGIGQTVTMGIVSATGRAGLNIENYEDFIQTDAAINPGNSGGPLVNMQGDVIGINTAIISRSGGNQGIGFAVPAHMARGVMDQLIAHGRVARGWLGVSIQPVTDALADTFELDSTAGALVGDVEPDSPAAEAGLATGDVVVAVDDQPVQEVKDLRLLIASAGPDATVDLTVIRDGRERSLSVTLDELPSDPRIGERSPTRGETLRGINVQDLTPQLTRQLGLPRSTVGVLVADVAPGSVAARAGLARGDVIQEVNRRAVNSTAEFDRAVGDTTDEVVLLVNRDGRTRYVVLD
ncbi:MAG: DegQ family serine endoprotease [Acidobacteria bacterium]|nr:DegQ family serine endoprotease [Acidobacteriota bacterium]